MKPIETNSSAAPASAGSVAPSIPEALAKLRASRERLSAQLAPAPKDPSSPLMKEKEAIPSAAASFLSKLDPRKDWYGQALKAAGAVTWEQAQAHLRQRVREHPLLAVGLGAALGFAVTGMRPWQITAFRAALGGMTFGARRWLWRQWGQPIMQAVVAETARSLMRPSTSMPRRTRTPEAQAKAERNVNSNE